METFPPLLAHTEVEQPNSNSTNGATTTAERGRASVPATSPFAGRGALEMMDQWKIQDAVETYGVPLWGGLVLALIWGFVVFKWV